MKKRIKRIIQIILGIILIILGIAGLILPFLQGFLFIITGILLISPYHGRRLLRCTKNAWIKFRQKKYKQVLVEFFSFFRSEKKTLKNYWKNVKKFNKKNKWWLKPKKEVKDFAKKLKKGKVLDIGCGMGRHTVYLAKKGFDVIAFDAAPDAVKYAKKWLKRKKLNAKVQLADFLDWNYKDDEYDGILSINTFHHATKDETKDLAQRISKSLKKGGIFLANVPIFRKKKINEKEIAPQTFVPLDGPEKDVPHFLFKKEQITEFFPDFEITIKKVKLDHNDDGHFDVFAVKK